MQILIVVLLCIIAVALVPWLFGILVAGAAAYGVIFVTAVVVAVFLIAAYAGHRFFIVGDFQGSCRVSVSRCL